MTEQHDSTPRLRRRMRALNARLAELIDTIRRIRRMLTELAALLMTATGLLAIVLDWLR